MMRLLANARWKIMVLYYSITGKFISYCMKYPPYRRRYWVKYYNRVRDIYNNEDFLFMNLGYASIKPEEEYPPEEINQINRFSEQLYHYVIGNQPIQGKEVLEVGCGRGGGSAYMMRQFNPAKLTAVDIAETAVTLCQEVHQQSGIHFQQADATALPFADQSFDAVINIESSHCYPSRQRFFAEVTRVLRPSGLFLYADLVIVSPCQLTLDNLTLDQVKQLLDNCGLTVIKDEDISKNVLKSRDLITDSNLFEALIDKSLKEEIKTKYIPALMPLLKNTFWLRDTEFYNLLKTGKIVYWSWMLQK